MEERESALHCRAVRMHLQRWHPPEFPCHPLTH